MLLLVSADPLAGASNPLVHLARRQLPWSFDVSQANLAPIECGIGACECCTVVSGVLDVLSGVDDLILAAKLGPKLVHVALSPANDSQFSSLMETAGTHGQRVLAVVPGVDQREQRSVANPEDIATAAGLYLPSS